MAVAALELVRNSKVRWAMQAYEEQRKQYQKYQDYYDGEHKLEFSTKRWKDEFGKAFGDFADNWCQVVVEAPTQRLEIIGWQSTDKTAEKKAEEIWEKSNVELEATDVHRQAFIKGDSYLMVWDTPDDDTNTDFDFDDDGVDLLFNDALDVNIFYDPANRRRAIRGSKKWETEEGEIRLNLYFPDRTEQYTVPKDTQAASLAAFIVPGETLPEGWRRAGKDIPNKYGRVPIFHFKNRPGGSTHGVSELMPVLPIQNAANKVLMDMLLGSEFAGFPQKWMAGSGHPKGGWKAGSNRVWATTDPNARFGQFQAMEFDGPREFVEMLVSHTAKTTQTPLHYLRSSGDMPSGEALKTAESGLVFKGKDRIKLWRIEWGRGMTFAVSITGHKPTAMVYPIYNYVESRHDLEQAQTAQLKSILGVPLKKLWAEHFGYTDEEIKEFEKVGAAVEARLLQQVLVQAGQAPPGTSLDSQVLSDLVKQLTGGALGGLDLPGLLAALGKGTSSQTTAGEATVKVQPNTGPPASPTRRSRGFRD